MERINADVRREPGSAPWRDGGGRYERILKGVQNPPHLRIKPVLIRRPGAVRCGSGHAAASLGLAPDVGRAGGRALGRPPLAPGEAELPENP